LDVSRYDAICRTEIVENGDGSLTAVRFHAKWPVILIGDEKGRIHAVKMSPNLRRNTKIAKDEAARNKVAKSKSRDSRAVLPEVAPPADEEDDGGNAAAEEEARLEALARDEAQKFKKAMTVSWIVRPAAVSPISAS
jgi:dynein intermediate chain 1